MEIKDEVSTSVALGYLSTTTAGMAFGLLCITIASLVCKLFICLRFSFYYIGSYAWAGIGSER